MKQSISNSIREPFQPLGIACDLFGVTLFRYNCKSKVIQVFSSVYTILIFSIFLPIILYRIGYVTPTLCQSNAVAQSVIGIQQILGMLVIVAIYFQVVFYKSDMKHIFQLFLSIDKAFNQLNIKFDYRRFRWKIKIEVAIVIGFIYGSFLYFLMYYRVQAMFSVILEFFTSIQTILLIYLVLLIFINFGWHIRNKFIALKSLLVDVCAIETLIGCDADDLWKVKLIQETPQVVFCEIRKIAQIYEMLFKTINLLNRIFGLSNLATMALLGISLTCHLFLLFKTLTENSNIFADIRLEILASTIWMTLLIVPLAYVTIVCHATCDQAIDIATIMHEAVAGKDLDEKMHVDFELLSLQFLHQNPKFSAYGFFHIDMTFVYAVCGAVTTYLVILLQFNYG